MNEIKNFIAFSKYAGERFDLVQAGGGNSSVKLDDGTMLIKASGFLLSDVEEQQGYSKVITRQISSIVNNNQLLEASSKRDRESITGALVKAGTLDAENRPSIETLLHSLLSKFTLHTHPIVVNTVVIQKNWKEIVKGIFLSDEVAFVGYKTPGIELALELKQELENYNQIPKIIFLQNHGLIISSNEANEISELTDYVVAKIGSYLQINMSRYKLVNDISNILKQLNADNCISYLSEDMQINAFLNSNKKSFFSNPFCPDKLVYCGIGTVEIDSVNDIENIKRYKEQYFELPKVIIFEDKLFVIAKNTKKAKEIEEVLKFHVMVLNKQNFDNINFLELEELAYLSNWEAEKYRQKI